MIRVENIEVFNFEGAIRGMRNPMNSWDKSDSGFTKDIENEKHEPAFMKYGEYGFFIGDDDLKLMQKLFKAGTEHRKFMRQIFVSMDITCHHTWWAEFDTYKVGVTRNSCSKMHRIHVKEFTKEDFSHEGLDEVADEFPGALESVIDTLEKLRQKFNETKERKYWRAIIELLPLGYNLRATVTFNYENAASMTNQRDTHKVDEWRYFVKVLKELPYMKDITMVE